MELTTLNSKKLIPSLSTSVDFVVNTGISKKKLCELSGLSLPTVRAIIQGKVDVRLLNVVKFITVVEMLQDVSQVSKFE